MGKCTPFWPAPVLLTTMLGIHACSDSDEMEPAPAFRSDGDTTVYDATSGAFSQPAPNLDDDAFARHQAGDLAFEAQFVAAPSPVNGGLGPAFNNVSCESCHPADGRGRPPGAGEASESMFLRISLPGRDSQTGGPVAVPLFGTQLLDKAIAEHVPLARFTVTYSEEPGTFPDGESYSLRRPAYRILEPYTDLPPGVLSSPRVAPPVFGRGLLEAIDESTIISNADENDADGDGISGKPNYVWDALAQRRVLGRFGLKANNPTLLQQTAGAYNGDIDITTPYFPKESVASFPGYETGEDEPELGWATLEDVTFNTQTLGVPARRNASDPNVRRGEALFEDHGCSSCHVPTMRTGTLKNVPAVSSQTIHAYTDLLLHDMGDPLADGRPDFEADGNEWRTPPLWGLGLTQIVNGHTFLLHDGRARSVLEAILWHGGEAEATRERFVHSSRRDREALLSFLRSL